jgi:hypothetical protein
MNVLALKSKPICMVKIKNRPKASSVWPVRSISKYTKVETIHKGHCSKRKIQICQKCKGNKIDIRILTFHTFSGIGLGISPVSPEWVVLYFSNFAFVHEFPKFKTHLPFPFIQ